MFSDGLHGLAGFVELDGTSDLVRRRSAPSALQAVLGEDAADRAMSQVELAGHLRVFEPEVYWLRMAWTALADRRWLSLWGWVVGSRVSGGRTAANLSACFCR